MRIVVLAGSGLSIGAGYPCTEELTKTVLSGQGGGGPAGPSTSPVREFLHRLSKLVTDYYAYLPGRPVNYEDLAYVARQLTDSLSGDFDNPALGPLHDALRADFAGDALPKLATEALNYITDVTWRSLAATHDADYFGQFVEFIRDERLEDVSVFTLNHDTLLERTFRAEGLEFADGFGEPVNGVRYWEPERLERGSPSRRLVKLHGSVDWFLLRPDGGEFHEERIAQVSGGDPWHTHDPRGRLQLPVDDGGGRPLLLIGTHNKARGYLNPPFFDAHIEFYRRLNRAEVLLVIGYGGQDKGVNERIVDWMESDLSHRLVIVDKTDRILEQARGALRGVERGPFWGPKGFPRWREQGRFELIVRPFENVTTADYIAALGLRGRE